MTKLERNCIKQVPDKGFTHGAKFHGDDVFSTALLRLINPDIQVTRGFEVPQDFSGIVYDIGRGPFDHHQEDREVRENGVAYAAFGLLWREYGTCFLTEEEAKEFDESFIQPMDESDNTGCDNEMASMISKFNPGWDGEDSYEERFWEAEKVAEQILGHYLESIQGLRRAGKLVNRAMEDSDGRILILPCYVPWKKQVIGSSYLFVVYPSNRGGYSVQGVPKSKENRSLVRDFPKEWWGKDPEQLQQLSGVATARFCHISGFMGAADTKEDAVRMAETALQSYDV
jgi:uncharacterized UPF0160 family protein